MPTLKPAPAGRFPQQQRIPSVLAVTPDTRSRAWFESSLTWSPAYRIRCVASGRDALRFLWRELFDVVVCDLVLPDGSWEDLLEEMSNFKHAPALVLAQYRPCPFSAAPSGVYAVVTKPFVERELLIVIDRAARHAFAESSLRPPRLRGELTIVARNSAI